MKLGPGQLELCQVQACMSIHMLKHFFSGFRSLLKFITIGKTENITVDKMYVLLVLVTNHYLGLPPTS